MKPNIDLTNNRMFQDNTNFDIMLTHIVGKIPWNNIFNLSKSIKSDIDLEYNYTSSTIPISKQLFPLGNKKERDKTKNLNKAVSVHYCDKCGEHIHIMPWKFTCSLCDTCLKELELYTKTQSKYNYPWKTQKTMTADTSKTSIFILQT